jgi:hypothetical protein
MVDWPACEGEIRLISSENKVSLLFNILMNTLPKQLTKVKEYDKVKIYPGSYLRYILTILKSSLKIVIYPLYIDEMNDNLLGVC